jgi:hypothetical protein
LVNRAGVSSDSIRHTVAWRGNRTQHLRLVTQHVDISDSLTTIDEHHRDVDQYLAPVMTRGKRAARQLVGNLTGPIRQQAHSGTAGMGHYAGLITRY